MNQWVFVIAAYGVALLGTAALLAWAWSAAHRAEAEARAISERRR